MATATAATPTLADHAHRIVIEERIAELWRYRQWWRANRWADWPGVRNDIETELRALVRLTRHARRIAADARPVDYAAVPEFVPVDWSDPRNEPVGYHDWQAR